jgi:hypothetical protein
MFNQCDSARTTASIILSIKAYPNGWSLADGSTGARPLAPAGGGRLRAITSQIVSVQRNEPPDFRNREGSTGPGFAHAKLQRARTLNYG